MGNFISNLTQIYSISNLAVLINSMPQLKTDSIRSNPFVMISVYKFLDPKGTVIAKSKWMNVPPEADSSIQAVPWCPWDCLPTHPKSQSCLAVDWPSVRRGHPPVPPGAKLAGNWTFGTTLRNAVPSKSNATLRLH